VSDYGIFNLIAGVIAMLSFLNAAMTTSTQRYLSYHQGTGDIEMQKKIFTNSWILHIVIGIILVVLLLVFVPFLFGGFLNIPTDRIPIAKALYYFISVSVFFTIIAVPFTASLNAHENMLWIAIVNIIESIIKLSIALSLFWFIQTERLIVYGVLMAALSLISFLLYAIFCLKKYNECNVRNYHINRLLIKELGGFAGWNLFGALCGLGKTQGLAIILNIFFGTIVNAAYGIANQVSSQLNFFSATMLRALNPQIMKSEGMNNRQRMLQLSMIASKFGFFLLALIAIPCIFEITPILKLWLKNVPKDTDIFCSLILIELLTIQLAIGLQSAIQATGRIKIYQLIVGGIQILNLPIAYILLKIEFPPCSILINAIIIQNIANFFRLYFLKRQVQISIREYFKKVFAKEIISISTMIIVCWIITNCLLFDFRFLITIMLSAVTGTSTMYFTGLSKQEKLVINNLLKKIKKI
jgi:O-antigen/teichoic acid export membrane protein